MGVTVNVETQRRVVIWKSQDESHDERVNMKSAEVVELEKQHAAHERRFGPLGGAAPGDDTDGLPQVLAKAEEWQRADPRMSDAEAFRRAALDPAVQAEYARERGGAQVAPPAAVGLAKAEKVAEQLRRDRPALTSAEAFRQAAATPAIRDAYASERAQLAGPLVKADRANERDEAALERRVAELEAENVPWRAAWSQALSEAGLGGGARAAAA